jgi:hypothetical protein
MEEIKDKREEGPQVGGRGPGEPAAEGFRVTQEELEAALEKVLQGLGR